MHNFLLVGSSGTFVVVAAPRSLSMQATPETSAENMPETITMENRITQLEPAQTAFPGSPNLVQPTALHSGAPSALHPGQPMKGRRSVSSSATHRNAPVRALHPMRPRATQENNEDGGSGGGVAETNGPGQEGATNGTGNRPGQDRMVRSEAHVGHLRERRTGVGQKRERTPPGGATIGDANEGGDAKGEKKVDTHREGKKTVHLGRTSAVATTSVTMATRGAMCTMTRSMTHTSTASAMKKSQSMHSKLTAPDATSVAAQPRKASITGAERQKYGPAGGQGSWAAESQKNGAAEGPGSGTAECHLVGVAAGESQGRRESNWGTEEMQIGSTSGSGRNSPAPNRSLRLQHAKPTQAHTAFVLHKPTHLATRSAASNASPTIASTGAPASVKGPPAPALAGNENVPNGGPAVRSRHVDRKRPASHVSSGASGGPISALMTTSMYIDASKAQVFPLTATSFLTIR